MGTLRVSWVLALVFLLPAMEGWAHIHRFGVGPGGRGARRSELLGFGLGLEYVMCKVDRELVLERRRCREPRRISWEADFSYVWGKHNRVDLNQFTAMAGPRVSRFDGTVRPFGRFLVGLLREDENGVSDEWLAAALGAGVDLGKNDGGHAFRVQLDGFWSDTTGFYPQLSVAFVFLVR